MPGYCQNRLLLSITDIITSTLYHGDGPATSLQVRGNRLLAEEGYYCRERTNVHLNIRPNPYR